MAYFNSVMNEILTKERQQMFLSEAEEKRLIHLATVQLGRHNSGRRLPIRNLISSLSKRGETIPAAC